MISTHLIVGDLVNSTGNLDELVSDFSPLLFCRDSLSLNPRDTSCFKISYSNC